MKDNDGRSKTTAERIVERMTGGLTLPAFEEFSVPGGRVDFALVLAYIGATQKGGGRMTKLTSGGGCS